MLLATLFSLFALSAAAVPTVPGDGQVPLLAPASSGHGVDLDLEDLRLVQFGDDQPPVWITELQKIEAKNQGRGFMDITDTPTLGLSSYLRPTASKYSYPKPGKQSDTVKPLFKSLDVDHMKTFLKKFTSFRTRYYRSETGRESQKYLLMTLKEIASQHPSVEVTEFKHSWGQNSLIAKFPHKAKKGAAVTVVGAHQDSTNMWPFLPAPGADDDGSGTTSALEAFRALCHSNFTSDEPVEFMWFSAEEGGLLGSQAVAKDYEDRGVKVKAMLQMDMTAWVKEGTKEHVGVIQDYVDPDLTKWVWQTIETYLDIPPMASECGYACSDHASFTKAGYQSAFTIESQFADTNKNIHSTSDTIDHPEFSFKHMREFSKLAIAFAVELSAAGK